MKFAAKRTWPDKSSSWEHQDDADNVEAFATDFASIEQLAIESEFVVMAREGADPAAQFFRVAAIAPYQLVRVERPRTATAQATPIENSPSAEPEEGAGVDTPSEPVGMPSLSPVISMLFYMGKVGLIATLFIALMAVVLGYVKDWLS